MTFNNDIVHISEIVVRTNEISATLAECLNIALRNRKYG